MKITDTSQICPYTGLRSFTEEESLYFKGRDEQIDQVTAQLEEKKFLMLTGASGEGKSSLIYAGLIPNARAGFFKSRFTNWTVVDFRPERAPVRSMALALAEKFSISQETIETEIRRGFSSLVDLYQNSKFFITDSSEQGTFTEHEKKVKGRSASNLLIIVDQFEEFFTNPENYSNEHPSTDSQIVVNLVLETARIALQQNLPIYVVCTMRSDYIGQCSSFRGLPEYIGYSQFFVPRLKRKELRQVIEEPALLSGNRISQRLTERLLYDLAEGVDQLPILQHALSQIWLMANRGADEMDLIHYAMVGGMPANELPQEAAGIFADWFKTLPAFQKEFYQETGLNKVIENHARRLYETAADYYNNNNPENSISIKDAKNTIALAFSCLTKIDNSRAVRNRMTVKEITSVINRSHLTVTVVGKLLDIFREEGNSFVRPFITENEGTDTLTEDTVLDITHESLIRNWGMLNKWANQEFEFYSTFLDLKKQLDRWKAHRRSQGYLLPIGPLSYFENWYRKCNPNVAWINRYVDGADNDGSSTDKAQELIEDLRDYLKRSGRKVAVSRAFLKYGAQKIALVVTTVIVLLFCGFYLFDASQKRNEKVINQIHRETATLLASNVLPNEAKATNLFINERLNPGSLLTYLQSIRDPKDRLALTLFVYSRLIIIDKKYEGPLRQGLNKLIDEALLSADVKGDDEIRLARLNQFVVALMFDDYYNPGAGLDKLLSGNASSLHDLILTFFKDKKRYKVSVALGLNESVHHWLTFGKASREQIVELIDQISPLSNPEAKATFEVFYPKGSYESNGFRANDFNGGYQTLAALYAAVGDAESVKWCFDRLKSQPDYFSDKLFNNYANVIGYFYQYGHRAVVPQIVAWLSGNYPSILPHIAYRELMIRSGYISQLFRVNFSIRRPQTEEGNLFENLCLASRDQFLAIAEDYQKSLALIKDAAEKNFLLATSYKRLAMAQHKYHYDRGIPVSTTYLNGLLDKAWLHYSKLSESDLEEQVTVSYHFIVEQRSREMKRRHVFLYPDYLGGWQSQKYHSDLLLNYILKKDLLSKAYKSIDDLNQIHYWLAARHEPFLVIVEATNNHYPINDSLLAATWNSVLRHPAGANFDGNLFAIVLSNNAFGRGDTTSALSYYARINEREIASSVNRYDMYNKNFFYNQLMTLAKNLALVGKIEESIKMIRKMGANTQRTIAYLQSANVLYDHGYDPATFILLDSAFSEIKAFDPENLPPFLEHRGRFAGLLNKIGGVKLVDMGAVIYREIHEQRKFEATRLMVRGIAARGDFYAAYAAIPNELTEEQDLICRNEILLIEARAYEKRNDLKGWPAFDLFTTMDEDFILFFGFI